MTDRALARLLRRLYRLPSPRPDSALEQALVERFRAEHAARTATAGAQAPDPMRLERLDAMNPAPANASSAQAVRTEGALAAKGPGARHRSRLRRIALAASVLVVLGAASRAPAEYAVELGRRVELVLPPGARPPSHDVLERAVGPGHERRIRVRARGTEASTRIELDLFGDGLPSIAELGARFRAAFPDLPSSAISVMPIDGRVHDSLGGALRWEVLRLGGSPGALARARERLIERLESEAGPNARVEVKIQDGDGKARVEIRVEKSVGSR